jgi:hypothetical protein
VIGTSRSAALFDQSLGFLGLIGVPSSTVLLTRVEASGGFDAPPPTQGALLFDDCPPRSEEGAEAPFSLAVRASSRAIINHWHRRRHRSKSLHGSARIRVTNTAEIDLNVSKAKDKDSFASTTFDYARIQRRRRSRALPSWSLKMEHVGPP